MKLRKYNLQTYSEKDAILLENRLYEYLHAETILNGMADNLLNRNLDEKFSSAGLIKKLDAEEMYGTLQSNEFSIEDKEVNKIRKFKRKFPWVAGDILPAYEIDFLLKGEEGTLGLIQDFLINNKNYLVTVAKDITKANWFGLTEDFVSRKEEYLRGIKNYADNLPGRILISNSGTYNSALRLSIEGPAIPVLQIRNKLKMRYRGVSIVWEEISYS